MIVRDHFVVIEEFVILKVVMHFHEISLKLYVSKQNINKTNSIGSSN